MTCTDVREHLSPHLEERLGPKERASVSKHLMACEACRALRDEMVALIADMRSLRAVQVLPEGLTERILARVAAPRPSSPHLSQRSERSQRSEHSQRSKASARSLVWQRAAVWAFVFFGAWWQLVGARLGSLAADEVAPVAAAFVAQAREATLRRKASWLPSEDFEFSLAEPVGRAGDSLSSFGRALHEALFVPDQPQDPSALQPQTQPRTESQGEPRP